MIINTGRAIEYETRWHGQGWIDIVGIKFGENVLEPINPSKRIQSSVEYLGNYSQM
jgi:hypothetical protein